jgi:hypothetical protein
VQGVEQEARQRGCDIVYLETFGFQAPEFYQELGYETACEIHGFPDGVVKYLMRRRL